MRATDAFDDRTDSGRALQRFARQIRTRNVCEWLAAVGVAVAFARIAWSGRGLLHVLSALEVVAAAGYIAWRLYRDGQVLASASEFQNAESARRALVREMLRQADLLSRAASWYVAPGAVGWFGLQVASVMERGLTPPHVVYAACGVAVGVVVVLLNWQAARKLRSRAGRLQASA